MSTYPCLFSRLKEETSTPPLDLHSVFEVELFTFVVFFVFKIDFLGLVCKRIEELTASFVMSVSMKQTDSHRADFLGISHLRLLLNLSIHSDFG